MDLLLYGIVYGSVIDSEKTRVADALCLFPGSQQIVGLGTVATNLLKLIGDLFKGAMALIFNKRTGSGELDDFLKHTSFIMIGLLRAVPVVGTIVSIARLSINNSRGSRG